MGLSRRYGKAIIHFVHPPEVTRKILEFFPDEALGAAPRENEEDRFFKIVPAREGLNQVAGLEPVKRFIRERMIEPCKQISPAGWRRNSAFWSSRDRQDSYC
jgi:hypothetical protein